MKPRRVVITIEVETDAPVKELKEAIREEAMKESISGYFYYSKFKVLQVQVNVIKKK